VYAPGGAPLGILCDRQRISSVANSLLVGHVNFTEQDLSHMAAVRFTRNTMVSWTSSFLHLLYVPRAQVEGPPRERLRVFSTENILDKPWAVLSHIQPTELGPVLSVEQAESWLTHQVVWREARNLYRQTTVPLLEFRLDEVKTAASRCERLRDWERFWSLVDTGSQEGTIRFECGDIVGKARSNLGQLTPEDFRLRSDSAGFRAGNDGKDLGADVGLVGPGPAYERWKKTPEYREWLKLTGQRE
jgi:hypothetical protein